SGDHVLALFGVALGMLPPDDARLGSFTLTVGGRRSERSAVDRGSVGAGGAGPVEPNAERRTPVALKLDQLPADVETNRAVAAVSVPLVIDAFLATPVDLRAPYRAAMRRAGDRAMEPLQGRLADRNPEIAAVAAEFMGLTGGQQAVALLLPLLRHRSEFVREAALVGLAEAGGREISRPAMPSLKD